jgi:hypothetical protein
MSTLLRKTTTFSLGTAATAANFAFALSMPLPTAPLVIEPLEEPASVARVASSRSPLLHSQFPLTTVSVNDSNISFPTRATSPQENIIGELRQWNLLDNNWDGEEAAKPKAQSIAEAVSFVRLLDDNTTLPEPMLLSSGNAALYWNETNLYADIEFLGDNRIAYFIKSNSDKHKGILTFDSKKMPIVLQALIRV